ncbi:hypothetical protein RUM43_002609 [Polyplax serrata]|uniref:Uncharacterized protein n=1 Tax=Polyplax serrata TaxID=468196 RepID=A0AAN8RW12_POLSC
MQTCQQLDKPLKFTNPQRGRNYKFPALDHGTGASERTKPKTKLLVNFISEMVFVCSDDYLGCHTMSLVSFGSSKGSMVETLIYETPLQEESEVATPTLEVTHPHPPEGDVAGKKKLLRLIEFTVVARAYFYPINVAVRTSVSVQAVLRYQVEEPPPSRENRYCNSLVTVFMICRNPSHTNYYLVQVPQYLSSSLAWESASGVSLKGSPCQALKVGTFGRWAFYSEKSEGREAAANRSCKVSKTVEVGLRQPCRTGSPPFGLVRLPS